MVEKKSDELPPLEETLMEPKLENNGLPTLEIDELWSFVFRKTSQAWVWIALCRETRQVVGFIMGDRTESTCRKLWEAIPQLYQQGHSYSDFWEAYTNVIPQEQHTAVGKDSGETSHVERWNNTLRQRLARFVRKTLSFSKSWFMHELSLRLFIHRYNCELIIPSG
jgi:insertion element IS1 protein InsB